MNCSASYYDRSFCSEIYLDDKSHRRSDTQNILMKIDDVGKYTWTIKATDHQIPNYKEEEKSKNGANLFQGPVKDYQPMRKREIEWILQPCMFQSPEVTMYSYDFFVFTFPLEEKCIKSERNLYILEYKHATLSNDRKHKFSILKIV